jgi:Tfp pilus assembly PilM family ATPase
MPEKILGLDISKDTIKAVQVIPELKGYEVTRTRVIDIRHAGGIHNALGQLFENDDFRSSMCILSLPTKHFAFRTIKLPFKNKTKINQTIPYELEPFIPYPISNVLIDYIIVDQSHHSQLLAAVISKSRAEEMIQQLTEHQVEASIIDIDTVPVASKLIVSGIAAEECGLVLDIGARDTTSVLFTDGKIHHVRHYSFGGENLTEVLADAASIKISDAEWDKREGLANGAEEIISEPCGRFLQEVKYTLQYLKLKGEYNVEPERIFLTGGGALYPPLRKKIEGFFSIPVETVDIRETDNIRFSEDTMKDWNPLVMNQALALATRETKKGTGFDYGPGEPGLKRKYEKYKQDFKWVASIIVLLFVLFGVNTFLDYHYDRVRVKQLKQEITRVFKTTFPAATRIVDPLQQMKVNISETRKLSMAPNRIGSGSAVLNILNDMARLVPESTDFLITSFSFDGTMVEIKGETDNFNTVDMIKNNLGKSNYFSNVKISSASLIKQRNRIGFDLKLELRQR